MGIWKKQFTLEGLNQLNSGTIVEHLGMEFTEAGEDYLVASLPVDQRTIQPMGLLHGGASVVLSETLGSVASILCLPEDSDHYSVGVQVNANHLRAVRTGKVYGRVEAVRIGRKIHVWEITIRDDQGRKSCVSRLTTMVVK